jgi:hypothetical protein
LTSIWRLLTFFAKNFSLKCPFVPFIDTHLMHTMPVHLNLFHK